MGKNYDDIIYTSAATAASAASLGSLLFPGSDLGTLPATWTGMTVTIALRAGHQISPGIAAKFITSILGGVAAFLIRQKAMSKLLSLIPGLGTLGTAGIDAFVVALITIRLGKFLAEQFEEPEFNVSDLNAIGGAALAILFDFPSTEEASEILDVIKDSVDSVFK